MRVLTIDLGMGAVKVCLWANQQCIARFSAPVVTYVDGDTTEQDAAAWWKSTVTLVHQVVAAHGPNVDVIAVTGQMHALVVCDAGGQPLAPVSVVTDRRARTACSEIASEFGIANLLLMTGGRLDPTTTLAKARRFHMEVDNAWQSARYLLPPKDFLRFQLTGRAITDPIDAAGTMFFDLSAGQWHPDLCAFVGITAEQMPEIRPTTALAGHLTRHAAEELHLVAGTPVAVGGGDDIESLGAGTLQPGEMFEHLGTTGSLYAATDRLLFDPLALVETYPDVVPGRYLLGGSTSAAGLAVRWILSLLGKDKGNDQAWNEINTLLQTMVQEERPAAALFLPYLAGERAPLWDSDRRAALLGLSPQTDHEATVQAVLEGVAFSLRSVLNSLHRVLAPAGVLSNTGCIHASGPLGTLAAYGQIRADIYNRAIVCSDTSEDTTSVAAMLLATCAITGENPFTLAQARFTTPLWVHHPRATAALHYAKAHRRFQQATDALAAWDTNDYPEGGEG